jgi:hypothetical protein
LGTIEATTRRRETIVSVRYLLIALLVLYVAFALFVPAMQNIFGYGFGTLLAILVLWYVFVSNRTSRLL